MEARARCPSNCMLREIAAQRGKTLTPTLSRRTGRGGRREDAIALGKMPVVRRMRCNRPKLPVHSFDSAGYPAVFLLADPWPRIARRRRGKNRSEERRVGK